MDGPADVNKPGAFGWDWPDSVGTGGTEAGPAAVEGVLVDALDVMGRWTSPLADDGAVCVACWT